MDFRPMMVICCAVSVKNFGYEISPLALGLARILYPTMSAWSVGQQTRGAIQKHHHSRVGRYSFFWTDAGQEIV